jgi:hypothetical protein
VPAPPGGRSDGQELARSIAWIKANPFVNLLLHAYGGLLAILNAQREILAMNDVALRTLRLAPDEVLGLRPGEAMCCVHAEKGPDGCGTAEVCTTCNAIRTFQTSRQTQEPAEGECFLTVEENGRSRAVEYCVRVFPMVCDKDTFYVLMLQDISDHYRREALENLLFFDLRNRLGEMKDSVGLALSEEPIPRFAVDALAERTHEAIQQLDDWYARARIERDEYRTTFRDCAISEILDGLRRRYHGHPLCKRRELAISNDADKTEVRTDPGLLGQALCAMIDNALEGTPEDGMASLRVVVRGGEVVFKVWNEQPVSRESAWRMFERNYTTKPGIGRGSGTYILKRITEEYLDGRVSFISSRNRGTMFRLRLALCAP